MSFTLRSLLLAFVVIASALGAFGPWGLAVGVLVVGAVAYLRVASGPARLVLAAIAVIVLIVLLLAPLMIASRESSPRMACLNNLRQISLSLAQYEAMYGTLPPAYVPGPDGKPWHSWRVLILPFLDRPDICRAYRFDEPWNGPNNARLAAVHIAIYTCPASEAASGQTGATSYYAVVGSKTAWPGASPRYLGDCGDDPAETIVLMEADLGACWAEPRDLDYEQLVGATGSVGDAVGTIPHPDPAGFLYIAETGLANVATLDGFVSTIPWDISGEQLKPLLTVNGGETVGPMPRSGVSRRRLNWPRIVSLLVLLASTLLLWWSTGRKRPVAEDVVAA